MKSSILAILLLTIVSTYIVQAHKSKCSCGNLGSGTNPCKCGKVVVKAARVHKPLYRTSPEAINAAAIAREVTERLFAKKGYEGAKTFFRYPYVDEIRGHTSSSFLGRLISGINGFYSMSHKPIINSGCGCGEESSLSLKISPDVSPSEIHHRQIVPRFQPIGDTCHPSKKLEVTTRVTPAYPVKPKCCSSTGSHRVCLNVHNGQIDETGLKKLGSVTSYSETGRLGLFDGSSSANSFSGLTRLGGYQFASGDPSSAIGRYNEFDGEYGKSDGLYNLESINFGDYHGPSSNFEFYGSKEQPKDYSYSQLPADTVSLNLAYKNLFPLITYNNKKEFVPEDKVAFGHRTVPIELTPSKSTPDVPEERLQIVDKPIVELKPIAPIPFSVGSYNVREEAKLAELEAIEREKLNQGIIVEGALPQGNLITYGNLGYTPIIDGALPEVSARPEIAQTNLFNVVNGAVVSGSLNPVGPPITGYVPGSIIIDQQPVNIENEGYVQRYFIEETNNNKDEEDDVDDTSSGIFTRLKSVAQGYGAATYPH